VALKQMYEWFYFPIAGTFWALGALGLLPRVKASTKGEGHERRYFYGSVWAVTIAQPVLWFLLEGAAPQHHLRHPQARDLRGHPRVCRNLARLGCCRGLDRSCQASSPFPTNS
jgi:hypothetical protein